MSKFIRTKDGIYDAEKWRGNIENRGEKSFLAIGVDYRGCTCYNYEEILKQTDTIEELCDELVLIEEDYPIILEELDFKRRTYLRANEYEFLSKLPEKPIIFGAIWTDKGLKYIAKMNDKGDLELI